MSPQPTIVDQLQLKDKIPELRAQQIKAVKAIENAGFNFFSGILSLSQRFDPNGFLADRIRIDELNKLIGSYISIETSQEATKTDKTHFRIKPRVFIKFELTSKKVALFYMNYDTDQNKVNQILEILEQFGFEVDLKEFVPHINTIGEPPANLP